MILRPLLALFAALALALPGPALAWGGLGHRTIGAIAWANIKPATRAKVAALLRQSALLDTPECQVRSLADAATWADCIRGEGDRFQATFGWHYQNEDVCRPYDPGSDCADGNCVSAQIERQQRLLADPARPEKVRVAALAYLTHFVGDIHQPLHSADDHDRGGNAITITGGEWDGRSLHEMWDGPIAREAIQTARGPLDRAYAPAEKAQLAGGSVADWGRESWGLARVKVYPVVLGHDPCTGPQTTTGRITPATFAAAVPLARRRIVQAGLRLARLLDEALGA